MADMGFKERFLLFWLTIENDCKIKTLKIYYIKKLEKKMYKIKTVLLFTALILLPVFYSCEDTGAAHSPPAGENQDGTQDDTQTEPTEPNPAAPAITDFTLTNGDLTDSGNIAVSITDNGAASAWMITTSDTAPAADSAAWLSERPTTQTLSSYGIFNLYAWAKNTAGTVSAAAGPISAEYVAGPAAGEVIVTEIMANPNAVEDTIGEWFEIYNTTARTINLKGCEFSDDGTDSFSVDTELLISSGDFLIFARADAGTSLLPAVDFISIDFSLSNSSDEIILTSLSGINIDEVGYTISDAGKSSQLSSSQLDSAANDAVENWSLSTAVISIENSDLGTPASANDSI